MKKRLSGRFICFIPVIISLYYLVFSTFAIERFVKQGLSQGTNPNLTDTQKTRLVHIFDIASEGIFHMDDQGNLTFYNPDFYQQFGFSAHTIQLEEWYAIVHPQDRAMLQKRVVEHIHMREQVTTQYRVRRTNGQYIWIEGIAVNRQLNGEHFMVGYHRDISDQKLMETFLNQAAYYDSISGLGNMAKLLRDIEVAKQNRPIKRSKSLSVLAKMSPVLSKSRMSLFQAVSGK